MRGRGGAAACPPARPAPLRSPRTHSHSRTLTHGCGTGPPTPPTLPPRWLCVPERLLPPPPARVSPSGGRSRGHQWCLSPRPPRFQFYRGDNARKAARPREPPGPGCGAGSGCGRSGRRAAFAAPHWYAGGGCAGRQTEKVSPGDGGGRGHSHSAGANGGSSGKRMKVSGVRRQADFGEGVRRRMSFSFPGEGVGGGLVEGIWGDGGKMCKGKFWMAAVLVWSHRRCVCYVLLSAEGLMLKG